MKRMGTVALAVCLIGLSMLFALPSAAEQTAPITLTAELDPELELSGDGTISFITFTLTNGSDQTYVLHNAALACEKLGLLETLDATIEVPAHGTKQLKLQNVDIADSLLDTVLNFELSWQDVAYAPEDLNEVAPIYTDRKASVDVTVPRFVEPVISVSVSTDLALAKSGSSVTATYTLKNDTKFDMTSLSLYDVGTLNLLIPLENTTILAGESMSVNHTFEMGETAAELQPKVLYNVRGKLVETTAESPVSVECAVIQLDFSVQTFPATSDGTLFSVSVTNSGSHPMTDITVFDEIQTKVNEPFTLAPEQTKTLSYLVTSAVSASQSRVVSFTLTATDVFLDTYTFVDPNTYEVLPYITSDHVNINLSATLTDTYTNENGVLCGTVSFELRNYSSVTLKNAQLRETLVYTASPLVTYTELTHGITTYSQDFAVADLSALSFMLSVNDTAGNVYSSPNVTLDLSKLSSEPAAQDGDTLVNPDVIGSGIDMNKYFKLAYKTLLIIAVCVGLCCVAIYGLYSAEKQEKRNLPLEDSGLSDDAFGLTSTRAGREEAFRPNDMEPLVPSEQASQLGYVAPTKLRYISRAQTDSAVGFSDVTTSNEVSEQEPAIMIYKKSRSSADAQTVVIKKKTPPADAVDGGMTKRFEQVADVKKEASKPQRKSAAPTIAPSRDNGQKYPKGIPSAAQANRKKITERNPVYRVQAQTIR